MDTSVFSILISLFWCSVFILFSIVLWKTKRFVLKYGVNFILVIMLIGIIRLFIPIELKSSAVIHSKTVMPFFQKFLRVHVFSIAGKSFDRSDVFILIWVMGCAIYLVGIILGILKTGRMVSRMYPEDHPQEQKQVQRLMRKIVSDSRPKQKYRVIISSKVETPMLTGYFTPTILLPPLLLSDEEMNYVLLHEWNHFLHHHLWTKLLLNALCSLLWWNPLIYLVKENLDYVLEVSCDRLVVNELGESEHRKYVEATVTVMRQLASKPDLSLSSIGFIATDSENIVQRCELVLFPPKSFNKLVRFMIGAFVLALVVLSYIFIVQPYSPPPIEADPSATTEYIRITSENAYLVRNTDDTYDLFLEGKPLFKINTSEIGAEPYSSLPIKNRGG